MSEANLHSSLQFKGYKISHIDFHCSNLDTPDKIDGEFKFNFEKILHQTSSENFQIELITNVFYGDDEREKSEFRLSLNVIGYFFSKPIFDTKWEKNALAILFPYVRAMVSIITSQIGCDPIILPTLNIAKLFENEVAKDESNKM